MCLGNKIAQHDENLVQSISIQVFKSGVISWSVSTFRKGVGIPYTYLHVELIFALIRVLDFEINIKIKRKNGILLPQ